MVKIVLVKVGLPAGGGWCLELVTDFLVFHQSGQQRSSLEGSRQHQCER